MPLIGDTIRLKGEFKDFNGVYVDPDDVVLKIYAGNKKQYGEDITPVRTGLGKYQYDYVVPEDVIGPLYFEFSGKIDGKPILGRATIDRRWV